MYLPAIWIPVPSIHDVRTHILRLYDLCCYVSGGQILSSRQQLVNRLKSARDCVSVVARSEVLEVYLGSILLFVFAPTASFTKIAQRERSGEATKNHDVIIGLSDLYKNQFAVSTIVEFALPYNRIL